DLPVDEHAASKSTLRLKRWRGLAWVLSFVGVMVLFWADHRSLGTEVLLLRGILCGVALLVLFMVVTSRAMGSWFVSLADRVRFRGLLMVIAIAVGCIVYPMIDINMTATRTDRLTAEITALTSEKRKGGRTYKAEVLVDGHEKKLNVGKAEWDSLSTVDAMDLVVRRHAFWVDRIVAWQPKYRVQVGLEQEVDTLGLR
ncbi:MAG: hypothetical protein WAU70_15355, partial [Flavobacteriales bacterium]